MIHSLIKYLLRLLTKRFQGYRIYFYSLLSKNLYKGDPKLKQPVLFLGKGEITFGVKNKIGFYGSPFFYNGYSHIEARTKESKIRFGNNIQINNNFTVVSEVGIQFGNDILIGTNVEIYDSDFHSTEVDRLRGKKYLKKEIVIKDNVWIGSNVKILKGVTIGKNSVIANGSIVLHSIDNNVVAAGIPAKAVKEI